MDAENFNSAHKFPQVVDFSSKFCIFGRNIFDKKNIGYKAVSHSVPLPRHDAIFGGCLVVGGT